MVAAPLNAIAVTCSKAALPGVAALEAGHLLNARPEGRREAGERQPQNRPRRRPHPQIHLPLRTTTTKWRWRMGRMRITRTSVNHSPGLRNRMPRDVHCGIGGVLLPLKTPLFQSPPAGASQDPCQRPSQEFLPEAPPADAEQRALERQRTRQEELLATETAWCEAIDEPADDQIRKGTV